MTRLETIVHRLYQNGHVTIDESATLMACVIHMEDRYEDNASEIQRKYGTHVVKYLVP